LTLGRSPSALTLVVRKKTYPNPIDGNRLTKAYYLQLTEDIYIISITVLRIDKLSRCEKIYLDQLLDGLSPRSPSIPEK